MQFCRAEHSILFRLMQLKNIPHTEKDAIAPNENHKPIFVLPLKRQK
jgi:hypothetical protein